MTSDIHAAASGHSRLIGLWFLLDAIVALAPPLYWMANDYRMDFILGVPVPVLYFIAVAVCIAASLIAAYRIEAGQGRFEE